MSVTRKTMGTQLNAEQISWLDAGIENFNASRFWHAHEDWEYLWKSLKGVAPQEEIDGVQGMIQIAAMLLNHQRHKARGVVNLWKKASAKLEPVLDGLFGINIAVLYSNSEPFPKDVELFLLDPTSVKIERQD